MQKGRPRLGPEIFAARLAAYHRAFGTSGDFPPYPGLASTEQHRAWARLYTMRKRLVAREAGRCEHCPCEGQASQGSVFCAGHRAANAARVGAHKAGYGTRKLLQGRQKGLCPVCHKPVGLWGHVDHDHKTGKIRGLLHPKCNHGVGWIERLTQEEVTRIKRYLKR